MLLVHKIASWILKRRIQQIEHFVKYPEYTQETNFKSLIHKARDTEWGRTYGYDESMSIATFQDRVPISTYEAFFPYIERTLNGELDVLWPGKIEWFAMSSGTTNDRSKYIPISVDCLEECHFRAGQDMLCLYLHNNPESKLFSGKSLTIGGSHKINRLNEHSRCGDLSAVIVENLPVFYELVRTPSKEVALMSEWEPKIEAMAEEAMREDVTGIAGVPTWTLVLINRIFEKMGITDRNLLEVWPNLELFLPGGVSFQPYRKQFEAMIPRGNMTYMEVYNASEGFFAVQNDPNSEDMLLMLDYGIFYEFIPVEHLEEDHPRSYVLGEVNTETNYAMLITTNTGLWRYVIGDTVRFTSLNPFKIRISGRTKHFINAFGEELMIDNAEAALSEACDGTKAVIDEYTAGPIYFAGTDKGAHEWIIEFQTPPSDQERFNFLLDSTLRQVNSDYDAKRTGDMALRPPTIHAVPRGTFHEWMRRRGKLGGQNKVPRLANNRRYLEEILERLAPESDK